MTNYIRKEHSIYALNGGDIKSTLKNIVNRFIAQNPEFPLTYRAYSKHGIFRDNEYRYSIDFNTVFPKAKDRQIVYVWGSYYSSGNSCHKLDINCICPATVYVNGEVIFKSTIFEERYPERRIEIQLPLVNGDNSIILEMSKTPAGFGMLFGTWLGKCNMYFSAPSKERHGQEGFIFTKPLDKKLDTLPAAGMSEKDTGVVWLPGINWNNDEKHNLSRMFKNENGKVICYTRIKSIFKGGYVLDIASNCNYKIFLNREETGNKLFLDCDEYDLVIVADKKGNDCYLQASCCELQFISPCNIWGSDEKWLYAGCFSDDINLNGIIQLNKPLSALGGDAFWKIDKPDMFIRPYNENGLFGRWNYPLGVTVYGLLSSSMELSLSEVTEYVRRHVALCCDTFDYAMWDKKQYGGNVAIHNLLASIDSLDDCGSFGSAMLETGKYFEIENIKKVADYVADYISNKQVRLSNGAFFRKHLMHVFHEDTMWADDLYMSVPFLCRYYQLTGEEKYIDDCVTQISGFREYLYMPEKKLMSHVFDFKAGHKTGVPWGRGNGWTIFTLSELLAVLPEEHEKYLEILAFFIEFCSGIVNLQDDEGMWHQVLTDYESYQESSCTAMFVYAFCKGIMNGWIKDRKYVTSAFKGFEALMHISIDKHGNLYGVCRGSEFSFNPDYYKFELLSNTNDTHGIGIVLLAGTELLKLKKWVKENEF